MYFGVPQIIYLVLVTISLQTSLSKHGQEKKGKYNFGIDFTSTAIMLIILCCGGFFSK